MSSPQQQIKSDLQIENEQFGSLPDGKTVTLFRLSNTSGMAVEILDYGGIVVRLFVPDRDGKPDDIVLGFDSLDGYLEPHPKFGAFCGRIAGRVANGTFSIDGNKYEVPVNLPPHHIHGGDNGFDRHLYDTETQITESYASLKLSRTSPHMEEGYPGNLKVSVTYTLNAQNELTLEYYAETDRPTVVNLTNHSYFNLKGSGDILGHEVKLNSDRFLETDSQMIPTGRLQPVKNSPVDFQQFASIGKRIDEDHPFMEYQGGYDHYFIIADDGELVEATVVREPGSGRIMKVLTTEPGVQFFTANFGDMTFTGKGGRLIQARNGFCLETQHYPDSPNHKDFPPVVLRPGEVLKSKTVYTFSVDE